MIYILDLFGISVFAISGALAARAKTLDIFGVILLSLVTAVGGGTLRDVILDITPVFWVRDPTYIVVVIVSAMITMIFLRSNWIPRRTLLVADAFGLALFAVLGTQTAIDSNVSPLIAIMMGVVSGVAGGVVRDMLTGQVPLILCQEIYATAAMCGAIVYVGMTTFSSVENLNMAVGILTALGLRLAAIKWHWSLPRYAPPKG